MAKLSYEPPLDVIRKLEYLEANDVEIFKEMVTTAGDAVYANMSAGINSSFKTDKSLRQGFYKTRGYKTPSDDGINCFVGFAGYNSKGVPIPLIAKAREYGTSRGERKRPFIRRAFKKGQIEGIMRGIEEKYFNDN